MSRRRVAAAAALLAAAGLVGVGLVVGPGVLADRLERESAACRDAIRATGLGDPRACPDDVLFRGITPGDRARARDALAHARARNALLAARVAAVRELDEPARDRALREAAAVRELDEPARDRTLHESAALPASGGVDVREDAHAPGASRVLEEAHAPGASRVLEEAHALGASRVLIDLASDPEVARRDPRRAAAYGMRAALVLGDRDAFVRIARSARATEAAHSDEVDELACLAEPACRISPADATTEIETLLARDDLEPLRRVLDRPGHQPVTAASWWTLAPAGTGLDAERARQLADRLAARVPPVRLRPVRHDERPEAEPDPVATMLLHGAWAHAVIAAQLLASAGDGEAAKRAMWRSEELAGDLRFGPVDDLATAAVRGLVSPTADALQWLVEIHDRSREPGVRARLRHMQAMLLVETERPGDALAALGRCRHDATCAEERWTRIAAAMLVRQAIQPRAIPRPTSRLTDARWCAELLRDPDTVPSLIVAPAADRARARWGCAGALDQVAGKVALPEWLYVAGWIAGDRDPEPWLDTLAPDVPIRRWQRARELAARWRGDLVAAEAWKHRREATEAIARAHPGVAAHLGI